MEEEMWGNLSSQSPSSPRPPAPASCSFISTALSLKSSHLLAAAHEGAYYSSENDNTAYCRARNSVANASPSLSFFSSSSSSYLCGGGGDHHALSATRALALEQEMCHGGLGAPAVTWAAGADRRKKRMIKNRESAARSRARKQAYVNELEKEVQHLLRENNKLREQYEELKGAMEVQVPVKRTLQRVLSAPF